jgi:hypothetical protein
MAVPLMTNLASGVLILNWKGLISDFCLFHLLFVVGVVIHSPVPDLFCS